MPRIRTPRRSRKSRGPVTSTEVMIAWAVLALDEFRDELAAERSIRRDADSFIAGNVCEDLDEHEARIARLEAELPLRSADEPLPRDAIEITDALDSDELRDRATIAAAIELELPVEFVYTNGDHETLLRHVSPYELKTVRDGRRFVLGWDHDRGGIRQFEIGKAETAVRSTEAVSYRQPEAA